MDSIGSTSTGPHIILHFIKSKLAVLLERCDACAIAASGCNLARLLLAKVNPREEHFIVQRNFFNEPSIGANIYTQKECSRHLVCLLECQP
jgi:hypothetical protein